MQLDLVRDEVYHFRVESDDFSFFALHLLFPKKELDRDDYLNPEAFGQFLEELGREYLDLWDEIVIPDLVLGSFAATSRLFPCPVDFLTPSSSEDSHFQVPDVSSLLPKNHDFLEREFSLKKVHFGQHCYLVNGTFEFFFKIWFHANIIEFGGMLDHSWPEHYRWCEHFSCYGNFEEFEIWDWSRSYDELDKSKYTHY
jgi:hypothetical protein